MKPSLLTVIGIVAILATAGCTKKAVAVSHPTETTPAPRAASTPTRTESTPNRAPEPTQARAATTPAARPANMPAQVRKTLNESLARMEDALFDYDKSTIRSDATSALQDDAGIIRGILADYPSQKLVIEGHCDERGSDEYNMALGDRRARAAEEFLVSMGLSGGQLEVISFGRDRPVCTDKTEDCWQKNRRAHFTAAP